MRFGGMYVCTVACLLCCSAASENPGNHAYIKCAPLDPLPSILPVLVLVLRTPLAQLL